MDTVQTPLAPAGVTIRPAGIEDLDALLGLESRCFDSDRLSRRSLRRFLQGESDHLLVAEDALGALGYILLLRRRGTRLARIYSICVDPEARGRQIAQGLMLAGESAVLAAGSAWVRLEVRRDNVGAIRLYERLGYRRFGEMPDYYEDGEEALRFEKRIRFHAVDRADVAVPYYSQTTPFTCGPASLMMAMSALRPGTPMDQREELRLWREATTIYMSSGHGGCGPQGLALAAWRRGFGVELFLNDDRVLFLDSVRDEHKKQILAVVHEDYCSQVADADIPTQYQPLGVPAIEQALAERRVPVVLISSWRLTREKAPHWVVVSAIDEDFVYIHDPEIKPERSEDRTDKQDVPIDRAAFARMARFGQSGMRAALLLSRARPSPRRKS